MLILDVAGKPSLFWRDAHQDTIVPLSNPSIIGKAYTTEKILILVCSAATTDTWTVQQDTTIVVGSENAEKIASKTLQTTDVIFVIDKATDNALTRVNFLKASTDGKTNSLVAQAVLERHRIIRFSAGGGLLLTRATPYSYSVSSVGTTLTTLTNAASTTTTNGAVTGTSSATTTATAAGTANYVFQTAGNNPQFNAIAGLTWYPFGRDTFPLNAKHRVGEIFTTSYSTRRPLDYLGIYVGTSVNTLGNFTIAPAIEAVPGIQVFWGPTWWNKTTLQSNVTACSGLGTSPSFSTSPSSTNTTNSSTTTTTSPVTTTVVTTTTTISTSSVSGCINGNLATILPSTTAPTQTSFQRSWAFGIVFNSNLIKAFSGLSK